MSRTNMKKSRKPHWDIYKKKPLVGNLNNCKIGHGIWNNFFQDTGHQATKGGKAWEMENK